MLSSYNIHCFFIFKCYNENIISEFFMVWIRKGPDAGLPYGSSRKI